MKKNLSLKTLFNKSNILKSLFYFFPIIMLCSSGYITAYVTFLTIFSLYYFLSNKIKIRIFILDYLILIFFLSSIVSTLINFKEISGILIVKSFLDIRFAIFFFLIRLILRSNIVDIKILSLVSLSSVVFLAINVFSQHLIGFDLFGNPPFDGRYNGIFESEAIAGSYMQKFTLVSILSFFLLKNNYKVKSIFAIVIIIFLGLGILLSLDRMPFIIYLFIITILLLIFKGFRFIFASGLILILLIFQTLATNYPVVKNRYSHLISRFEILETKNFLLKKEFYNNELNNNFQINQDATNTYLRLYRTSYEIFLKNPFFGSGIKSFGTQCNKLNISEKKLLCLTHPHNIYLEIIVNQGIVGLFIFLTFILLMLKRYFFNFYLKKNIYEFTLNIFFFTILITELIPIRSYGSIFQTVNGSLFWFLLALASTETFIKKINSK